MKWINKFKPLIIRDVNTDDVEVEKHRGKSWIITTNNKKYLMIMRSFKNKSYENINDNFEVTNASIEMKTNCSIEDVKLYLGYGNDSSIIIDMNGIDNFRYAKSEVFNDYTIRKIVKKMNLLKEGGEYLRIGASGSRESSFHPGGEVFEYSLINSKKLDGLSQNVSGYLPNGECYSKSICLHGEDKTSLREERIVYSHTAWLKKCNIKESKGIYLNIISKNQKQSLLDIINEITDRLDIVCFSIQIYVKPESSFGTEVNGRVLKHMPEKPFKDITEVVDISFEKRFKLEIDDTLYGMGTKYERYEPEWTEFTNGGKYERRGHIHATIINEKLTKNKKHETFHLRDIFISPTTDVKVVLTPINTIYRIYPIHKAKNNYRCDSSEKDIDIVIENIYKIDRKKV